MNYQATFYLLFGLLMLALAFMMNKLRIRLINQRMRQLRALAARRGLRFFPGGLYRKGETAEAVGPKTEFCDFFPLFKVGSNPNIGPALVGEDKHETTWYLFDYSYTEPTGNGSATYTFGVVVAMLPVHLPAMILDPTHSQSLVERFIQGTKLEVESEEFNRRYLVQTVDRKMSLDLLHPAAIEALLQQPTLEWQMTGPFLMLHVQGLLSANELEGLMGFAKLFIDQIPPFYRADYSYQRVTQ